MPLDLGSEGDAFGGAQIECEQGGTAAEIDGDARLIYGRVQIERSIRRGDNIRITGLRISGAVVEKRVAVQILSDCDIERLTRRKNDKRVEAQSHRVDHEAIRNIWLWTSKAARP